ncbi:MAG: hypothetical protein AAB652_01955 [Patescibacteria group bacterium]
MVKAMVLSEHGIKLIVTNIVGGDRTKIPNGVVGFHDVCGGSFVHQDISETYSELFCRKCRFRKEFPNTIKTLGQLRRHLLLVLSMSSTAPAS